SATMSADSGTNRARVTLRACGAAMSTTCHPGAIPAEPGRLLSLSVPWPARRRLFRAAGRPAGRGAFKAGDALICRLPRPMSAAMAGRTGRRITKCLVLALLPGLLASAGARARPVQADPRDGLHPSAAVLVVHREDGDIVSASGAIVVGDGLLATPLALL